MSDISEKCKHTNTKIWEPHLAGARKCLSCDMVYNPNMGGWYVEEPSIETQLSNLKSKHEKVLEMLRIAEKYLKTAHEEACTCCDSTGYVKSHCYKALAEIEELKK